MFHQRTAWFSSSVGQIYQNYWMSEGGHIANWRTADYLFSRDAANPDTSRIFESEDYLRNKVTVFHSLFLSVCEQRRSVTSVYIGHYVLPPVCVQDEVRNVVGRLIWEQEYDQCFTQSSSCNQIVEDSRTPPFTNTSCEQSNAESSNEGTKCCEVRQYPVNNMVTGYISIDNLQKYSGELWDFQPGLRGCSVFGCETNYQVTKPHR